MPARICNATRVNGEPCKARAARDEETCPHHRDSSKLGAQPKLTPELADLLVQLIKAGNYIAVAVRAAGISRSLFYRWLDRGASSARADAPYRELRDRVEHAKAEAEARNVAAIASHARDNWQAAAWLLERQYPERWGRVSVRMRDDVTPPIDEVQTTAADDPFAEVDELAEVRKRRGVG